MPPYLNRGFKGAMPLIFAALQSGAKERADKGALPLKPLSRFKGGSPYSFPVFSLISRLLVSIFYTAQ
jgi:hypothetical protein